MEVPSFCFIVNEHSNSGRAGKIFRINAALVDTHFPDATVYYISNLNTMEAMVSDCSKRYDVLVACGGDGTVHTVAKACWLASKTLGVIPLGSGNDFAKTILPGSKLKFKEYLLILKSAAIRRVDVPLINGNPFFNTLGIGFDGLTNLYASNTPYLNGNLKYVYSGLKTFIKAKPFAARISDDQIDIECDCWMLVIANGAVEGGKYKLSPGSINNDGKIEIIVVEAYSRLKLLFAFLLLTLGSTLPGRFSKLYTLDGSCKIEVKNSQILHFDGETGRTLLANNIQISPHKLYVIEYSKIS